MCCFCREHEKPSDAAVVTSRDSRHSILLRSTDTSSAATQTLRQLVALVQGPMAAPAGQGNQGGQSLGLAADEALARRLQVRLYGLHAKAMRLLAPGNTWLTHRVLSTWGAH